MLACSLFRAFRVLVLVVVRHVAGLPFLLYHDGDGCCRVVGKADIVHGCDGAEQVRRLEAVRDHGGQEA